MNSWIIRHNNTEHGQSEDFMYIMIHSSVMHCDFNMCKIDVHICGASIKEEFLNEQEQSLSDTSWLCFWTFHGDQIYL